MFYVFQDDGVMSWGLIGLQTSMHASLKGRPRYHDLRHVASQLTLHSVPQVMKGTSNSGQKYIILPTVMDSQEDMPVH